LNDPPYLEATKDRIGNMLVRILVTTSKVSMGNIGQTFATTSGVWLCPEP
jgi:hypothetical protein